MGRNVGEAREEKEDGGEPNNVTWRQWCHLTGRNFVMTEAIESKTFSSSGLNSHRRPNTTPSRVKAPMLM
ncbi:hypothetical protein E2C01_026129 [Portunus trituberculatus]|uniref:Uncharacterized protein n=1 Tax=Portunus trituberculatus TaxID=210409 RepID=A0A5B7EHU0_PORTR|nr:hypothetical protein [Portunus trituberculatus]